MRFLILIGVIMIAAMAGANADAKESKNPQVRLETTKGKIILELYPDQAPATVRNFRIYVVSGFYEGTIFHRVIPGFMIQGGGFTVDMTKKTTHPPIKNEADNGLKNNRGTISMARTSDPHSATSQFFINTVNNTPLNHQGKDARGWGYAVFGRVIEGMEVIDAISRVKTGASGRLRDVPEEPVIIQKTEFIE